MEIGTKGKPDLISTELQRKIINKYYPPPVKYVVKEKEPEEVNENGWVTKLKNFVLPNVVIIVVIIGIILLACYCFFENLAVKRERRRQEKKGKINKPDVSDKNETFSSGEIDLFAPGYGIMSELEYEY